jgi:hypothetical protein
VYKWFGSVPSVGPGAGNYGTAIQGWNYAEYKFPGDMTPPPGVPVYFGIDTPRTDPNAKAGDVVLSLGGGRVVCTDSPNGNTGIMTIAARAAQVRRNYLGWTADFLGHEVSGAQSFIAERLNKPFVPTEPPVAVVTPEDEDMKFKIFPHPPTEPEVGGIKGLKGGIFFRNIETGKQVYISDPNHVALIQRVLRQDGTDQMLQEEIDLVIRTYIQPTL